MDLQLSGKLALVTGASKGIGRATAAVLAQEGCDLVMISRDPTTLNAAADAIRLRSSVSVRTIPADLSKQDSIERVAAEIPELDILVNNAGAIPPGNLLATGNEAWRAAWDLKVFGYIGMCRALYPSLKRRNGVIVNIIGAAGERLDPNYIAGSTGNASLMAFTKSLAKGAVKDGMRVVGINPGPVATDRLEVMMRGRAKTQFGDESRWKEFLGSMSFGRAATPEEIGSAVAFLASARSGYTSGTILTIDGAGS
ncbi:MAG TPA: short-chain dehydrogenase/reductase [Candidatus Acidoferrales bacterium]|nr:short-chain dehydrogenase/reductase [Candidatus Acidoferrales bacterium]